MSDYHVPDEPLELVKIRLRLRIAEGKLAVLRELCHAGGFPGDPLERTLLDVSEVLAIIGDEE